MGKYFYKIIIEAVEGPEAFLQICWAFGRHAGEAVDAVLDYVRQEKFDDVVVVQVDLYDFDELPGEEVLQMESGIFVSDTRFGYPLEEFPQFRLPYGVIPAQGESDWKYEDLGEGFIRYQDDNGTEHLAVAVDGRRLLELFIDLVRILPSIRVLWLKLAGDWEEAGVNEFYANESLCEVAGIDKFLQTHPEDTVRNGFITITVYSDDGTLNLSLDEHKMIHWSTAEEKHIDMMAGWLEEKGYSLYKEAEEFRRIAYGYHHYHFRPGKSRGREELVEFLRGRGFYLWRREEKY